MSRPSPFARGFRAVRREPSVLLAEIAWRWLFGAVATALIAWAVLVFLKSVEVSRSNQFLLRTLNPELMSYALSDIFRNKWAALARVSIAATVGLSFLWIITSSIARTATTRVLLEDATGDFGEERETRSNLRAVSAIQFVRVALLWIGFTAYVFAAVIADRLTHRGNESHVGGFLLLFLAMILAAGVVLSFFNWILLLAPIYAIRDHLRFSDATLAAWRLTRERSGSLAGLNLAHAGIRLVWLVVMTGLAFAPLGFVHILPKVLILAAMLLISLVYFAVADVLFVARYAGYIEIAEQQSRLEPEPPAVPQPEPTPEYAAPAEPGEVEPPVTPEAPAL